MPVTVRFTNGNERDFQAATTAYRRGGILIVAQNGEEIGKFDSIDVVVATVTDQHGVTVETVPGRATSN